MHYVSVIPHMLKSSLRALRSEVEHCQSQGTKVCQHIQDFLDPAIRSLDDLYVLTGSMVRAGKDDNVIEQYARRVISSLDSHIAERIRPLLNAEELDCFQYLYNAPPVRTQTTEDTAVTSSPSFALMRTVTTVAEGLINPPYRDTDGEGVNPLLSTKTTKMKVPSEVIDAIKTRKQWAQETVDKNRPGNAFNVVGHPFPAPHRVRFGYDSLLELLEHFEQMFKGNEVEWTDLREIVTRLSTYGSVVLNELPSELVMFLYTAGTWNAKRKEQYQHPVVPPSK